MERRLSPEEAMDEASKIKFLAENPDGSKPSKEQLDEASRIVEEENPIDPEVKNPGLITSATLLFKLEKVEDSSTDETEVYDYRKDIAKCPDSIVMGTVGITFGNLFESKYEDEQQKHLQNLFNLKKYFSEQFEGMVSRDIMHQGLRLFSQLLAKRSQNRLMVDKLYELLHFGDEEVAGAVSSAIKSNLESGNMLESTNLFQAYREFPGLVLSLSSDPEVIEMLREKDQKLKDKMLSEKDRSKAVRISELSGGAASMLRELDNPR